VNVPVRIASILGAILGCYAFQLLVQRTMSDYSERLVVLAGLYVTLAVSLNLINGITGQFSIGHAAFYQVGAYGAAFVTGSFWARSHTPAFPWLLLMVLVGAALAAIAGLVVGLPSLRLRGDYLAIVTLGFGEIIRIAVQNVPALGGSYGYAGMNVLKGPSQANAILLVWLLAVLTIAVCRNLLKTAHGLPFLAVREDEIASSAMGVNVTRVKVAAFVLGSAFAGAAGALLAHYEGFITPQTFRMDVSFIILTMVVLGGTGSITGSAVAAIFLSYLPEYLRDLKVAIPAATVFFALIAVGGAVAIMKRTVDAQRGTRLTRGLISVGAWVAAAVVAIVLGRILGPRFESAGIKPVNGDQLRMVIFAVTLIVLMLMRPQGIFGHHEFSWDWVKKILGRKDYKTTEVAA
jgi:branched-chain amino acid transport system permease protein